MPEEQRPTETGEMLLRPVAHMRSDWQGQRFGIPRQSGLVDSMLSRVILEKPYRRAEALRALDGFTHLWLIWQFSQVPADAPFHPTVRPPRLGGNRRVGVFASRAPYRPNRLGLSCVELAQIVWQGEEAPYLIVRGADLLDGTPIYDIKPYVPLTDLRPDAAEGYTAFTRQHCLRVVFPEALLARISPDKQQAALDMLSGDPRPGYERKAGVRYGMRYAQWDIGFTVEADTLTVFRVDTAEDAKP